jgi:hypothetical protein
VMCEMCAPARRPTLAVVECAIRTTALNVCGQGRSRGIHEEEEETEEEDETEEEEEEEEEHGQQLGDQTHDFVRRMEGRSRKNTMLMAAMMI